MRVFWIRHPSVCYKKQLPIKVCKAWLFWHNYVCVTLKPLKNVHTKLFSLFLNWMQKPVAFAYLSWDVGVKKPRPILLIITALSYNGGLKSDYLKLGKIWNLTICNYDFFCFCSCLMVTSKFYNGARPSNRHVWQELNFWSFSFSLWY